jgi:hypothetical protein
VFAGGINRGLLLNLFQKLCVTRHCLPIESCAVLTVAKVVVEDVVAGVEADCLLEFDDSFLVQSLRLVVDGQA